MGDLTPDDKKGIGNLDDPDLPFDYREREYGTVPIDETRARFQWVSEIAYKNVHRIVARGYDTTELMEEDYGLTDVLFVNFQARIPTVEEDQMLNYVMIMALEDGLSAPVAMSRLVAQSKTFLTQACGASIHAFGHAYGAYSACGNRLLDELTAGREKGLDIDDIGAIWNAGTWWEGTSYFHWVQHDRAARSIEILSDMMRSTLPPEEFDTEKNVILEEIAMYRDLSLIHI